MVKKHKNVFCDDSRAVVTFVYLLILYQMIFASEKPTNAQIQINSNFGTISSNFWGIKETRYYIGLNNKQNLDTILMNIDNAVLSVVDTILSKHTEVGKNGNSNILPENYRLILYTISIKKYFNEKRAVIKVMINSDSSMLGIWCNGIKLSDWKHSAMLSITKSVIRVILDKMHSSNYIGKQVIKSKIE